MFSLIYLFRSVLPPVSLFLSPKLLCLFPFLILFLKSLYFFFFWRFLMSFLNATLSLSINILSQWQAFFFHSFLLLIAFFFLKPWRIFFIFLRSWFRIQTNILYLCMSPKWVQTFQCQCWYPCPSIVSHSWIPQTSLLMDMVLCIHIWGGICAHAHECSSILI